MNLKIPAHTAISVKNNDDLGRIDRLMLGVSAQTHDEIAIKKGVATFVAYTRLQDSKIIIHAPLEYGTTLGVYEIGLFAGEQLVGVINQQRERITKPLFIMRDTCMYLADIVIDTNLLGVNHWINQGALSLMVKEKDELTHAIAHPLQTNNMATQPKMPQTPSSTQAVVADDDLLALTEKWLNQGDV